MAPPGGQKKLVVKLKQRVQQEDGGAALQGAGRRQEELREAVRCIQDERQTPVTLEELFGCVPSRKMAGVFWCSKVQHPAVASAAATLPLLPSQWLWTVAHPPTTNPTAVLWRVRWRLTSATPCTRCWATSASARQRQKQQRWRQRWRWTLPPFCSMW